MPYGGVYSTQPIKSTQGNMSVSTHAEIDHYQEYLLRNSTRCPIISVMVTWYPSVHISIITSNPNKNKMDPSAHLVMTSMSSVIMRTAIYHTTVSICRNFILYTVSMELSSLVYHIARNIDGK